MVTVCVQISSKKRKALSEDSVGLQSIGYDDHHSASASIIKTPSQDIASARIDQGIRSVANSHRENPTQI